ncbi:hypothetical protein WS70_25860 [Burkholderia mayonis]|uniref:Putative tail fiber protein gp53-like C-terminal domain-containing protein n=1 Tax=Burkholderia mayonis TaxID=1385591 RepID=A0A1B4FN98_9BURK|nr:hypothetical protein [Burkholderia mayonis]AOJ05143.1 hypothetical protein WS70_25860 [Burkholderia mayonis]KVE41604.1 hypothetical protein WS70_13275 [Burkholderia mayonis]
MDKLVESSQWEEDLYQIETSDPVEGGPDGVSNKQAKQLGGRTRYLKQHVEQSQSGLASHIAAGDPHPQYATKADLVQELGNLVGQAPGTLDTLNEIAQALGKDPNFATTMTNALALKAPIDSPVFTSVAKGVTPPQFDNSTKLATTAFAQRALGNRQAISSTNTNQTLTLAQCGQTLQYYSASGGVWTLPTAATIPNGAEYEILNGGSGTLLIQVAGGSDKIISSAGVAIASVTLQSGDSIRIVGSAGSYVYATGGTGTIQWSASFGSSIALNGYQKLPSGLIIQWGAFTSSASGDTSVAWPIAFPSTCLSVISTPNNNGYSMVTQYNSSRTGALFNNWQMSGGSAVRMAGAVQYVAIGN